MGTIAKKFNKSSCGVIVPYSGNQYVAYVVPDDGGVLVQYHKASEAMPAFDTDSFPSVEEAEKYIEENLMVDKRTIRKLDPENEW